MSVSAIEAETPQSGGEATLLHRLVGPAVAVVTGLGIVLLAQAVDEPNVATSFSPRWWPVSLGVLTILLSLGVGIKEAVRPSTNETVESTARGGALKLMLVLAAVIAYGFLWYYVDFRVSTFLFVAALVLILGGRGWRAWLLFPALCMIVLYALFGLLLKVPL